MQSHIVKIVLLLLLQSIPTGWRFDTTGAPPGIVRTAKGTAQNSTGTTVTLSSITLTGGASLMVGAITHQSRTFASVTWGAASLVSDVDIAGATNRVAIWSTHNVTAGTNDIVVTISGAGAKGLTATQWTGLTTSSTLDKTASDSGSGTAPDSGSTATTAQDSEALVGAIGINSGSTSGTWQDSFTAGQEVVAGGFWTLKEGYKIDTAAGTRRAATTGETSANWVASIATYRGL